MSDGVRRAAALTMPTSPTSGDLPTGVVTAVTSEVATVKSAQLGAERPMPRLASYTPAVGHQVVLARAGGRWIILGQLAGIPT